MADAIARRVKVHGRVQGVFFRDTARRRAQELGLSGWIRNCPDGTVEALFEGEAEAIEAAVEFCRRGPPRAEVADIDVWEAEPSGQAAFEVR